MAEVNLLSSLPQTKRNVNARATAKTPEIVAISKKFGEEYFDGDRSYGYGGYKYDGRWLPVAHDIIKHFNLKPGQRVLDVGCAKGFLVKDLLTACPGLEVYGLDISEYAAMNCPADIIGRIHVGHCERLPFPDNSFDAVISINTIHNCTREGAVRALKEIQRLSGGRAFIQVDSYLTAEQRNLFIEWMLTAEFHDYPEGWFSVFEEAGYTGDHYWTMV